MGSFDNMLRGSKTNSNSGASTGTGGSSFNRMLAGDTDSPTVARVKNTLRTGINRALEKADAEKNKKVAAPATVRQSSYALGKIVDNLKSKVAETEAELGYDPARIIRNKYMQQADFISGRSSTPKAPNGQAGVIRDKWNTQQQTSKNKAAIQSVKNDLEAAQSAKYYFDQEQSMTALEKRLSLMPQYNNALQQVKNGTLQMTDKEAGRSTYQGMALDNFNQQLIMQHMTPEQIAIRHILYATDPKKAAEYDEYVFRLANEKIAQEEAAYLAEHPGMAAVAGVVGDLGAGLSWIDAGLNKLSRKMTGEYKPVDLYSNMQTPARLADVGWSTVSDNINNPVLNFLVTGLGRSIPLLGASVATGGTAGLALMGASSAGNKVYSNLKKGINLDTAFDEATINGVLEGLLEKLPLDNLLKMARNGSSALFSKKGISQMLKQSFGVEAPQEMITQYAQTLSDISMLGDKSEFMQAYNDYLAQGMSEREAENRAIFDFFVLQPAVSGAAGAILGGGSGAIATGYSGGLTESGKKGKMASADEETKLAVLETGFDSPEGSEARNLAEGIYQKMLSGEEVKTREWGRLYQANQRQVEAEEDAAKAAEEKEATQTGAEATQTGAAKVAVPAAAIPQTATDVKPGIYDASSLKDVAASLGPSGQKNIIAVYKDNVDTATYAREYLQVYNAAMEGRALPEVNSLSDAQIYAATMAGHNDRGKISTAVKEDNNGEEVRIRESGQREAGESTRGPLAAVEESTAANSSGRISTGSARPADSGAVSLRYRQSVSTAALGISEGSSTDTVYTDPVTETEAMAKARAAAKKAGKRVIFFAGNYLTIRGGQDVRARISGDRIFLRADDPDYTADQIIQHELGHDRMDKGEIDPHQVKQDLIDKGYDIQTLIEQYVRDYKGAGLTAEEVWEEMICDALGGMNMYADIPGVGETTGRALEVIRSQAEENAAGTRGPPAEKAAAEDVEYSRKIIVSKKTQDGGKHNKVIIQLRANMKKLRKTEPVTTVSGNELPKNGSPTGRALAYLESIGMAVDRKGFGRVAFSKTKIKNAFVGHGMGNAKIELIAGVPDVIKNGAQIDYAPNWENQGYDSYIFAGKVLYRGTPVILGVVVNRDNNGGRYYVHEAIDENGDVLFTQKEEPENVSDRSAKQPNTVTNSDSINSLPQSSVKSNTQNNGKSHNSRKVHVETFETLKAQNEELQDKVAAMKEIQKELEKATAKAEHYKAQLQRTKEPQANQKDIERLAKQFIKDYSSNVDREDIADRIKDLTEYVMRGGEDLEWAGIRDRAVSIAKDLVENAEELDDSLYKEYKALRQYFRSTRISVDQAVKDSWPDGWSNFRKANMGRINLVKDGTDVTRVYQEAEGMWPELFPEGIDRSSEQLEHIAQVLRDITPVYNNPFSVDMAAATECCANDLIDSILDETIRQADPTFADRMAARAEARRAHEVAAAKEHGKEQVAKVREQKNEKIAQIREENRQRTQEALRQVREQRDRKMTELRQQYQEQRNRARDRREARELRDKIYRHAKDLGRKLATPTDKQHIPYALQPALKSLLEAIDLESNYDFASEGGRKHVGKGEGLPTKRTAAFRQLREAYSNLAGELVVDPALFGNGLTQGLFDDVIALSNKRIVDMGREDLQTVWTTLRAVEASIQTANKIFSKIRWGTVDEMATVLWNDNDSKKAGHEVWKYSKFKQLTRLDMLTPETYFHMLGSAGEEAFRVLRNAQDQYIRIMQATASRTEEMLGKYDVKKAEKTLHSVMLGGQEVQLTTAQLMEMYVLLQREQAVPHMLIGGILPESRSVKGKIGKHKVVDLEPYRKVTLDECLTAVDKLTAEEKNLADQMQKYLSEDMGAYGNKASMEVYGYEKFGDPHYWPIRVNKQEVHSTLETETQAVSVANMGMTKAVKSNAGNSLRIGSIFDTFSEHVHNMATYSAYLGPLEDINRLRNYSYRDANNNVIGTARMIIDRIHGQSGARYLTDLMTDIAGGIQSEAEYLTKMLGNFKAASVALNMRVILQQPTSIIRALDMIAPQYLIAGMKPSKGWQKAKKYAPIAQWKDWGYFDITNGRQMKDVFFDTDSVAEKMRSAQMWAAGKADAVAWGQLWNACELETKAKHKELFPGSKQYYEHVAKRFTEIIDHSQVVDGILQRSAVMRHGGALTKMATAFMGEPTKIYNMAAAAVYDMKTAKDKTARAKATQRLVRTGFTLLLSGLLNAVAQSLWDAIRDDDKEKKYWERFVDAFTGFTGEEKDLWEKILAVLKGNIEGVVNPATYLPYAKDVLSIIEGYDVKRLDMEAVADVWDDMRGVVKAISQSEDGKYTSSSAIIRFAADLAKLMGFGVTNLKRDIMGVVNTIATETDNYLMQYHIDKLSLKINNSNLGAFVDILYGAYKNDPDAYEIIFDDLIKNGIEESKIVEKMEAHMKEDQGVTSVKDLPERYMTPNQQKVFDSSIGTVKGSSAWGMANSTQKNEVTDLAKEIATGRANENTQEKINGGRQYGVTAADYLEFKLALSVVDTPNKYGNYGGTPTRDEVAAALRLMSLSTEGKKYLWVNSGNSYCYDYNYPL